TGGATRRRPSAIGLRRAKPMMITSATTNPEPAEPRAIGNEGVSTAAPAATGAASIHETMPAPTRHRPPPKPPMARAFTASRPAALAHEVFAIEDNLEMGDSSGMQKALQK